ncbi:MAG: oxidoreductase [Cognatishimia sp.]|uniref:PDR/VanB family oxidoreductase n=1 Tax=Cognatishimia sp. TaxID=2211648 RepID=UPI003B8C57D4
MALINVKVEKVVEEAEGVKSFLLTKTGLFKLPKYEPGAHLDVHCGKGVIRQYSLCGDPEDRSHYMIAVKREDASRGGSEQMHDDIIVGQKLEIGSPRNNFKLDETAKRVVLLAGGIGITPIISMADRLHKLAIPFELHYFTRSEQHTAFHERLSRCPYASVVNFHVGFDVSQTTDYLNDIFGSYSKNSHAYICGPGPFMDSAENIAVETWPQTAIHLERFAANPALAGKPTTAFQVELRQLGVTLDVGKDETILSVLEAHEIEAAFSCEQGVCGTCVTDVIEGSPDHRDSFLSEKERKAGKKMCICVSRTFDEIIVLNL